MGRVAKIRFEQRIRFLAACGREHVGAAVHVDHAIQKTGDPAIVRIVFLPVFDRDLHVIDALDRIREFVVGLALHIVDVIANAEDALFERPEVFICGSGCSVRLGARKRGRRCKQRRRENDMKKRASHRFTPKRVIGDARTLI